jgi:hypothetical protein
MQNFLFAKTWSATWCGTSACSAKQGPKRKNRCTQLIDVLCVAHFRQKLKRCAFLAQSYAVPFGLAQDPQGIKPVEEMCWLTSLKLSAGLNCSFGNANPNGVQ